MDPPKQNNKSAFNLDLYALVSEPDPNNTRQNILRTKPSIQTLRLLCHLLPGCKTKKAVPIRHPVLALEGSKSDSTVHCDQSLSAVACVGIRTVAILFATTAKRGV
jgi:hypothetical protein